MNDSLNLLTDNPAEESTTVVTLTLGIFFDGTANNAFNTRFGLEVCSAETAGLEDADALSVLAQCAKQELGYRDRALGSHVGYYTNIHWLNTLYETQAVGREGEVQLSLYIEGIGTEEGEPDMAVGMAMGTGERGIIAKTDKAVASIAGLLSDYCASLPTATPAVSEVRFDVFGFSRGAAAARHFANRVFAQDSALVSAIAAGMAGKVYAGKPAGKVRFLGLFDTVAAVGTAKNGFNPHAAKTGEVNLMLRPGVAEKVFQIAARHECRFNFALNSVKPAWPELVLAGVHSDIGGGYHPEETEHYFLTRPQFETVSLSTADEETRLYKRVAEEMKALPDFPAVGPIVRNNDVKITTWSDDRMPADHYGMLQKRSGAAAAVTRTVRNDWAKVALRVMMDAAQEAGARFRPIEEADPALNLPAELDSLCEKAIGQGKAVRSGQPVEEFTAAETDLLASRYLHCSANWNAVTTNASGSTVSAVKPARLLSFTNRPDDRWQRTSYDMDGNSY
ncbi:DUF2235 domain-containing protein [Pantoea sp. BAV 3049]|uniref:T6SS phospholipase effector Tle1-like catalytic domain-containing protein n=1 Tax=Pantoea sp. BAV 3049 TaxID=2654188 RepID=UPI00131CFBF4|nr:DUF2235 domain-containing protein [Pantoea sp. BAV 3049]